MSEVKKRTKKKLSARVINKRVRGVWNREEYDTQKILNEMQVEGLGSILEKVASGEYSAMGKVHGYKNKKLVVQSLQEADFKKALTASKSAFRESSDPFGTYEFTPGYAGTDFVPVLGGPQFKQLYQTDFIKQANLAFYALNHDPFARAAVNIIVDFTLGRGFRVDSDNKAALAVWRAFEKANRLQEQMAQFAREVGVYGEMMWYKLPAHNKFISFNPGPNEEPPKALIPRVRLVDPTNIWDFVTAPEDIYDVQYYVWVAPTQWQTYTGLNGNTQPSSKFIFKTIEPENMLHYKVNAVSNEKRGRSDLFPILGYLKRLRDAVDYSIISQLKQSAWSIDTTVEGDQADIDAYIEEQNSLGSIPPAGSEFVHTSKIKREYMGPTGSSGSSSGGSSFEWTVSMIAAGTGIPLSYFGTHLSGGNTRASALVSTEPFAKKCEMRQILYKRVIQELWDYCMESFGITAECEITLPEIVSQDATQKIKNTDYAVQRGYFSKRRAGNIIAKELNVDQYDYNDELKEIGEDKETVAPLSAPPKFPSGSNAPMSSEDKANQKNVGMDMSPMDSGEKEQIKNERA